MTIKKKSFRSGPFKDFIAQGVLVNNVLYLSGQVGMDQDGKSGDDIASQTAIAYENLKTVLAEFGAGMDNIVDETFFVTDINELMTHAEGVYGARTQAYGGLPEVSQTVVQIVSLVQPEFKIEIKCVAHL
jgi:enamine deaminase RidA (YjgF/YER057c/UK114 family)